MNELALVEPVKTGYDIANFSLHALASDSGKHIFRVEPASGQKLILRAYPSNQDEKLQNLITILSFLEDRRYPAERIIPTASGNSIIEHNGWRLLMTTHIDGSSADYTFPALHSLAAMVGRLHALRASPQINKKEMLPEAEMLPAREITYALMQLTSAKPLLPCNLYHRYDALVAALQNVDLCDDLPTALIHNDCHPANAVHTPTGQVILIDWEGAGSGPAVIDVGFLLASCDTESPWTPPLPLDPARVIALVDGYCQHHVLTRAELERLPDAIRFRAIVFGACSFASAIKERSSDDDSDWWWKRYNAADDIAERASQRFEQYF